MKFLTKLKPTSWVDWAMLMFAVALFIYGFFS